MQLLVYGIIAIVVISIVSLLLKKKSLSQVDKLEIELDAMKHQWKG